MQWGRFAIWALVATLGIGGVALAADALVESDEERVSEIADAMTGSAPGRRIDALLAWVDPTRVPVTVRANGYLDHYGEDDGDPAGSIRDALAPLSTDSLDVVQRSISVDGERATVALRVRSEGEIVDAQLALRRDGQTWLVSEVRRLQ